MLVLKIPRGLREIPQLIAALETVAFAIVASCLHRSVPD